MGIGGHDAASCPPIPAPAAQHHAFATQALDAGNTASSKSPWPHLSLTERRFLETGIGTRGVRRKDKADPVYYNTGSCVHPRCITGIEITATPPKDDGPIHPHFTLVKRGYIAGNEICAADGCRTYPLSLTRTVLGTG